MRGVDNMIFSIFTAFSPVILSHSLVLWSSASTSLILFGYRPWFFPFPPGFISLSWAALPFASLSSQISQLVHNWFAAKSRLCVKFSSESVCLFFGWNKASCWSFVEVLIEEGVFLKYVSNFIVVDLHEVSNFIQTLIFTYCRYYYCYCYYLYNLFSFAQRQITI